jgi:uncharacterized membrane protein YphA (DoxX/SURF4 family)
MKQKSTLRNAEVSGARAARTTREGRGLNIALWVLQVIAAAVFVMASIPKLTADPRAVEGFEAIGFGNWFLYLIGILELAGAVALLIPILSGLAGLALAGLMIGAVTTQVVVFDGEMVAFPAATLVVVAIIAWGRRRQTARLLELLRIRGQATATTHETW